MRIWMALGLGVVLTTGLATGGDAKKEEDKLQGSWTNKLGGKIHTLKFDKDTFFLDFEDKDKKVTMSVKGTFKLDASKKPKEMDLTVTESSKFKKGDLGLAIYELDGDTLKWCANRPGREGRPAEFPEKEGEGKYLNLVFKRAK